MHHNIQHETHPSHIIAHKNKHEKNLKIENIVSLNSNIVYGYQFNSTQFIFMLIAIYISCARYQWTQHIYSHDDDQDNYIVNSFIRENVLAQNVEESIDFHAVK